jgi:hypothetical protein
MERAARGGQEERRVEKDRSLRLMKPARLDSSIVALLFYHVHTATHRPRERLLGEELRKGVFAEQGNASNGSHSSVAR